MPIQIKSTLTSSSVKLNQQTTSRGFKKFLISAQFAMAGWRYQWQNEPNFRTHVAMGIAVIGFGFIFGLTRTEWLAIILMIGAMLTTESLNTAIERTVDLASKNQLNPLAKIAKDVAAGACLITAITAIVVGLIIFIPYFIPYLRAVFHL